MRTLHNSLLPVIALTQNPYNTDDTFNGEPVDLGLYGNDFRDVLFVVDPGSMTDGTFAFVVEECGTVDGEYVQVADEYILGTVPTVTAADEGTCPQFGYKAHGVRFVRVVMTSADTDDGSFFGVIALLGNGCQSPPLRS